MRLEKIRFQGISLPVIGCSASVPYNDDFLCALKVSHGPDMTLAAILKRNFDTLITFELRANFRLASKIFFIGFQQKAVFVMSQTDSMLIFFPAFRCTYFTIALSALIETIK